MRGDIGWVPVGPSALSGLRPAEAAGGAAAAAMQPARLPFPGPHVGAGALSLQGRGAWEPPGRPAPDSAGQGWEGSGGGLPLREGFREPAPGLSSRLCPFFLRARPSTGPEPSRARVGMARTPASMSQKQNVGGIARS